MHLLRLLSLFRNFRPLSIANSIILGSFKRLAFYLVSIKKYSYLRRRCGINCSIGTLWTRFVFDNYGLWEKKDSARLVKNIFYCSTHNSFSKSISWSSILIRTMKGSVDDLNVEKAREKSRVFTITESLEPTPKEIIRSSSSHDNLHLHKNRRVDDEFNLLISVF